MIRVEDNLYNASFPQQDNLYNASFPQQKLPLSKKNEKWQQDCVNYIIGEGNVVSGGMSKTRFGEI